MGAARCCCEDFGSTPAARLVPAAAARLAAADWAGFRALCAEAGEVGDPHRRYEARRALLEMASALATSAPRRFGADAHTMHVVQPEPEPRLVRYALDQGLLEPHET